MKETVFTDDIVRGLKRWHKMAKKRLLKKKSVSKTTTTTMVNHFPHFLEKNESVSTSNVMKSLPSPKISAATSRGNNLESKFKYPSGRLELLEIQRVVEEMIECSSSNIPFDGEISFRQWKKQVWSPRRQGNN